MCKGFILYVHADEALGWFGDMRSHAQQSPVGLGHFPQKCQRFRANGFLAIRYINALPAKFCNILTVQKFYSDFLVVFRMLP